VQIITASGIPHRVRAGLAIRRVTVELLIKAKIYGVQEPGRKQAAKEALANFSRTTGQPKISSPSSSTKY
jgi:hypothetical protein